MTGMVLLKKRFLSTEPFAPVNPPDSAARVVFVPALVTAVPAPLKARTVQSSPRLAQLFSRESPWTNWAKCKSIARMRPDTTSFRKAFLSGAAEYLVRMSGWWYVSSIFNSDFRSNERSGYPWADRHPH